MQSRVVPPPSFCFFVVMLKAKWIGARLSWDWSWVLSGIGAGYCLGLELGSVWEWGWVVSGIGAGWCLGLGLVST